jgi:spore germination protein YaaH
MLRPKIRFLDILYWLSLLGADFFVYAILGILLMDYDDNWDASKGEYGTWASMNTLQKTIDFAFILWNILNVTALIYALKNIYRWVFGSHR